MKTFFKEFKKFITRGNVVDMAVGVIVGSAFTAIVNGVSNFVLKPVINWLLAIMLGKDSLSNIHTFLIRVDTVQDILDENGNVIGTTVVPDLTQSIYIDWGSLINAVLNFFIVAIVLFTIVRVINRFREEHKELGERIAKNTLSRAERRELKLNGINIKDKEAVAAFFDNKLKAEKAAAEAKAAEEAEKARLHRLENPTTEDLLKSILEELRKS